MDTEDRLAELEKRLAAYDEMVGKIFRMAAASPKGRLILKVLGVKIP